MQGVNLITRTMLVSAMIVGFSITASYASPAENETTIKVSGPSVTASAGIVSPKN